MATKLFTSASIESQNDGIYRHSNRFNCIRIRLFLYICSFAINWVTYIIVHLYGVLQFSIYCHAFRATRGFGKRTYAFSFSFMRSESAFLCILQFMPQALHSHNIVHNSFPIDFEQQRSVDLVSNVFTHVSDFRHVNA